MNPAIKYLFHTMAALILLSWAGCSDPNAVIDQNTEIDNNNWSYANKIKFDVKIDNENIAYNLYLNLRVTGDYKYSNLFVLIRQINPDKKTSATRYETKLANPDGEWLGNYKFPTKGIYHFQIEQNMRDNPLHEISDVGLRVEKAQ
jgi:gliding motility-associated lipoprotein GldH